MKSHAWRVLQSTEHYRCLVCERCGASKHYSRAGLTDDIRALQNFWRWYALAAVEIGGSK
jgi:hypothetical protein